VLGLSEVTKPQALRVTGGVWFAIEDGQIHIGVDPDFRPVKKAHPALVVSLDQLSVLAVRLAASGYPVERDDRVEGVERFFTSDPFGNRLEFMALALRPKARRSAVGARRTATALTRSFRQPGGRRRV
jgi:hypothetical protein